MTDYEKELVKKICDIESCGECGFKGEEYNCNIGLVNMIKSEIKKFGEAIESRYRCEDEDVCFIVTDEFENRGIEYK